MRRYFCLYILLFFVGCTNTTSISDTVSEPPRPIPDIPHIRFNPGLRLPFKQQLEWQLKLHKMPPGELWKLRRALEDGMFSDPKTLMREGRLYPRGYGDKDV